MNRKTIVKVRYLRYQKDWADRRRQQRLAEDLGLDREAVEVIMRLIDQVSDLQARLREMESRLELYQSGEGTRLARYREAFSEAVWEDVSNREVD